MNAMPSTLPTTFITSTRPDWRAAGRSICVTSPVMTAFDPNPRRVRNIFICSEVVFCASWRITNASLRVRPRMNAIGAPHLHHVVERVVARAQVGVHLLLQIAGQEAELLAGFDRRTGQDDAAHAL